MTSYYPITSITAREILDSRGNPTIECTVTVQSKDKDYKKEISTKNKNKTSKFSGTASVPSGASTGKYEALELRDGGKRYDGLGVLKAIKNIETKIFPKLKGIEITNQIKIDQIMIDLDNTPNKSNLGANAILAVSLACARTAAISKNIPLYQYLNNLIKNNLLKEPKPKMSLPKPFFNILNGGRHAGGRLAFQEFMIVPQARTFHENLEIGSEIDHALKKILKEKYGPSSINVGDEGGFAPQLKTAEEALNLLQYTLKKTKHSKNVRLAIDCAASEFYDPKNKVYHIPKKLTSAELLNYYLKLIKKYNLLSIEDPFNEDDFITFAKLKQKSKIQIVGDDLTVTNPQRIKKAIQEKSCNCLLLKVNQIGTLTEALQAAQLARKAGWKIMVSHRSGETDDFFIADLAVALGCGMIKAGAPNRGERLAKDNRLLEIETEISK
ncbi:phosphopyruvate hydratase [Candidatus Woesearchaeota archaeon]|nr:phosphopyruvate hydratase [Candidatus Woesearchaeota archaeon]